MYSASTCRSESDMVFSGTQISSEYTRPTESDVGGCLQNTHNTEDPCSKTRSGCIDEQGDEPLGTHLTPAAAACYSHCHTGTIKVTLLLLHIHTLDKIGRSPRDNHSHNTFHLSCSRLLLSTSCFYQSLVNVGPFYQLPRACLFALWRLFIHQVPASQYQIRVPRLQPLSDAGGFRCCAMERI